MAAHARPAGGPQPRRKLGQISRVFRGALESANAVHFTRTGASPKNATLPQIRPDRPDILRPLPQTPKIGLERPRPVIPSQRRHAVANSREQHRKCRRILRRRALQFRRRQEPDHKRRSRFGRCKIDREIAAHHHLLEFEIRPGSRGKTSRNLRCDVSFGVECVDVDMKRVPRRERAAVQMRCPQNERTRRIRKTARAGVRARPEDLLREPCSQKSSNRIASPVTRKTQTLNGAKVKTMGPGPEYHFFLFEAAVAR